MLIKRFGETKENPPIKQWYELPDGKRIDCDEEDINTLWENWVSSYNSRRVDDEIFTVFEFIKPAEFTL